jgi:dTDP-glucose 4,6-dehydratase
MNLLVTGGAGFIGSNLVQRWLEHEAVDRLINLDCLTYAGHLANLKPIESHPKYRFEPVDLRDKKAVLEAVERHHVTHVIHLAAESHVDRSITGPGDFIQTNVVGTFHLLEACRALWKGEWNGKRFHHVSTDEVYGSLGATGYFTENSPYAPNSPYSASKASSDLLVRAYHHTYGMPTVTTHCSNNYGPFQFPEKLIPVVIQRVLERRPIPVYGDGQNVRDWLHVEDHCDALWEVLNRGRAGEVYCIGGHNEWANLPIVEQICDLVDELRPDLAGKSRSLITFVEDRLGHDRRYAIDAGKIQSELGWKPKRTFEEGLRQTVQWYVDHQSWVEEVKQERMLR